MPITVADGVSIIGADASTSVLTLSSAVAWPNVNATFKNVTIKSPNANYTGIQHASSIKYENCVIEGQPFSYATTAVFDGCTFNQTSNDAYNIWTYGSKNITFNECVFNCAGKAALVYNEGAIANEEGLPYDSKVVFNGCSFIATETVKGKAAIEIDQRFVAYEVYINNCTAKGFAADTNSGSDLWNNKKGVASESNTLKALKVVVDGIEQKLK